MSGGYETGQRAAERLSEALFGRIIDRMLEQDNSRRLTAGMEWARLRGTG